MNLYNRILGVGAGLALLAGCRSFQAASDDVGYYTKTPAHVEYNALLTVRDSLPVGDVEALISLRQQFDQTEYQLTLPENKRRRRSTEADLRRIDSLKITNELGENFVDHLKYAMLNKSPPHGDYREDLELKSIAKYAADRRFISYFDKKNNLIQVFFDNYESLEAQKFEGLKQITVYPPAEAEPK